MLGQQPIQNAVPTRTMFVTFIASISGQMVPICLYCLNCTKCGQLILRKIAEIVATRYHILRPKCTKFSFGWVSVPDPTEAAHGAPQMLKLDLRGLTDREGEREEGRGEGKTWTGEGSGGKEKEGEG